MPAYSGPSPLPVVRRSGLTLMAEFAVSKGGIVMATRTLDRSIDVECSRHDAFDRLSRVEDYTQFPEVVAVEARGGKLVHLVGDVEGRRQELDVEIDRQPDERISMYTVSGPRVNSQLTFEPLDERHTRLVAHVEYDPQQVHDRYQMSDEDVAHRLRERLERIKSFVEETAG